MSVNTVTLFVMYAVASQSVVCVCLREAIQVSRGSGTVTVESKKAVATTQMVKVVLGTRMPSYCSCSTRPR